MYCGSCLRDNALAAELIQMGHEVTLVPIYTPTLTDEANVSRSRVFFGGISVYLQQLHPVFRKTPWIIDRLWDSRLVLRALSGLSVKTNPGQLGALTLSMLHGERGFQKKELWKLLKWLKQESLPDIISLPNSLLIGLAEPLGAILQRPICCTLQGEDLFLDGLSEPYRSKALSLIREKVRFVNGFAPVSAYCSEYMQDLLGITEEKMHPIPLGIRVEDYGKNRSSRSEIFRVGFLSRITPEKGLHILCQAYQRLKANRDLSATRLEVAGYLSGEHRDYLNQIKRQIQEWGLASEFQYHGTLDRQAKIRFLENLDVLSVPAIYGEQKGLPILEAMASGVPVVQPRRGSFTEMLDKTSGGILTDPTQENSLEDGLYSIYRNKNLAKKLGQNGRLGVKKYYSVSHMARVALQVYSIIRKRSTSEFSSGISQTFS